MNAHIQSDQSKHHSWMAIRVKSRFEKMTAAAFEQRGYTCFLPLYVCRRRWSDRNKVGEFPLFPGYLFCRFNPLERTPILETPGVVQIVGIGRTPVPVADVEIEALQTVLRSGCPVTPWAYVAAGQSVRIEDGPLSGVHGILLEVKNERRIILSVSLLRRSVSVEIDPNCVRPLESANKDSDTRNGRLCLRAG
jgi:transcription antitermination factor NusG